MAEKENKNMQDGKIVKLLVTKSLALGETFIMTPNAVKIAITKGMVVSYSIGAGSDEITFMVPYGDDKWSTLYYFFGGSKEDVISQIKGFGADEIVGSEALPYSATPPANDSKALRYNDNKIKWSLVHFESLEPMVKVLMFGAKKYSADNWKKGLDKKEILESMMRHLAALMDREAIDEESGVSHMGHIQCNAMFFNYFENHNSDKI